MTPNDSIARLHPDRVEYRSRTSSGVRVVQVYLSTPTPRVSGFSESWTGGYSIEPLNLFIDEIIAFVLDAGRRKGVPDGVLSSLIVDLAKGDSMND